jgi:hypothetical protein
VRKGVEFLLKKFVVPAAGVLTTLYDTVQWVFRSLSQFQGLAEIATRIVGQIDNVIAKQPEGLAGEITRFLNGLIPVGINFLAGQLGWGDLPRRVADTIE